MGTRTKNGHILIVSDQQETERLWLHCLEQCSLRTATARFDAEPRHTISLDNHDLIILDILDSPERALAICRYARATFSGPILLFTYEHDERFHVQAYRVGIDESITKPIGSLLSVAKVLSWLRRTTESPDHARTSPNFRIDAPQRLLTTPEGRITKLSKLECRLLSLLIDNSGKIVSPDRVLDEVWAGNPSITFSHLKNLVYRLRKKIEPDPEHPRYLHTVPRHGYSFVAEIEGR